MKNVPQDCLGSNEAQALLQEVIQGIENREHCQNQTDHYCETFVKCIQEEMDRVLPSYVAGKVKGIIAKVNPTGMKHCKSCGELCMKQGRSIL